MSDKVEAIIKSLEPVLSPVLAVLRPYTGQLPPQIIQYGRELYTRPVFDTIILKLDLFSPSAAPLLTKFIATSLGYAIVGSSGIIKLPQILSIISNASTTGLSFVSILLETISQLITLSYNFRQNNEFTTFGESAFLSFQNIIILLLILYYSGLTKYINGFIGLLSLTFYSLFANPNIGQPGVLSNDNVQNLIKLALPLTLLSKLPQILNNIKNKSTGQLSPVSVGAGFVGAIIRVFTTLSAGIQDHLILLGFGASLVLNAILFIQILVYKKKPISQEKKTN
ncbi:Mannose-P-dolichol utilization defect 1 protein [Wickerhamomyces ciferrii]|uniref:Mannose-P-dolichol utilization defect 1 protein homolog n=1 Tax=Wickerhamomyces ciferrii (strain ATCC 14091 / BCRC 22168 / CBS 111 / JCM 3599 / NBRC 0793 / NRRL Y-1031 F-60-10) TaxID=1206466 RepID=K0KQE6_WICCF|nr:Mannose-P-dolichol utilization defect 1 protein [Wickerhamomyces ciferrii]CCH44372.1 Mannose-P-dolichol utilization defect 1 protein [Wickerhamomyces ciferrii]